MDEKYYNNFDFGSESNFSEEGFEIAEAMNLAFATGSPKYVAKETLRAGSKSGTKTPRKRKGAKLKKGLPVPEDDTSKPGK